MSIFSSYKKIFLLGFIAVILVAIPFSVYIAQKRQNIKSKAAAATTLSFAPSSATVKTGGILTLDIVIDPGSDPSTANLVSFAKLALNYDASKFATVAGSLTPSSDPANTLDVAIDGPNYESGKASISLSMGADPNLAVKERTKIATLKLKATAASSPTTSISFDYDRSASSNTQILSIDNNSQTSDNVLSLSNVTPATITITGSSSDTSTSTSTAPTCVSLNADRTTTGVAPYPITFTVIGNDSDGVINKVSFNFGDGPVQDISTGGGIGTNSVNAQISHSFNAPGTFTAYAILTDNNANLSAQQANCSKTITVTSGSLGSGSQTTASGTSGSSSLNFTDPIAPSITIIPPQEILPPTGPGDKMLGIGILGAIFAIIGGALLLL